MRIIEATSTPGSMRVRAHIDETKTVRDPEQAPPGEDEEDTRAFVPDPEFVLEIQWGADVPIATIKRETALLCAAELSRKSGGKKVAALTGATLDPLEKPREDPPFFTREG